MNFYGLFLGLGFLIASFYLWRLARREAFGDEKIIDVMLLAVLFGAIFGRVGYALLNWEKFSSDFGRILLFVKYPGFLLFGILLGIFFLFVIYSKKNNFDFWKLCDLFVVPGALFTSFGYLGAKSLPVSGGYFLLFLFLLLLENRRIHTPEWRQILERPGILTILFLTFTFAINLPVGIIACILLFLIRYNKVTKSMIKFPQQVLSGIKKYLEDRRRATEHQIAELKKEDPFEDKSRLLDQAANDSEANQKSGHERTQVLMNQLNIFLIEIKKALTKIKIGKYGICENCGKMIDTDRLAAIPMATICVDCAKKKVK
ncbi:hypothetical protein A2872_00355 [Candidatus Gottesmanbacteria bacterium RIFCSPHIGHO2_01_FULL_42_12]|uniref:Zinc finger DksA/TraR C4-type domain-containing protein n=1 Tax=Candidatus Gottesmanbacteria bacterium RIFCSPHIGHO2_01_FULL_42_12 TaxID=1798377 RepID=A0A1F5Z2Z4_9BACT|nr:MAG: hypothetical protein A2872_00355 [Candidatus Gottesmanbacteria bacterium RIFCSPHIGHO2_01_FULL_42_12]